MESHADAVDVKAIAEGAAKNLYWQTLGMRVVDAKRGWSRVRLPITEGLLNAVGAPVHGGVIGSLVDASCGAAVATLSDPTEPARRVTLDMNVSYLNAAFSGDLFAEATVIKSSSTLVFISANIYDARQRLIATGRCTYMRLDGRKQVQTGQA